MSVLIQCPVVNYGEFMPCYQLVWYGGTLGLQEVSKQLVDHHFDQKRS